MERGVKAETGNSFGVLGYKARLTVGRATGCCLGFVAYVYRTACPKLGCHYRDVPWLCICVHMDTRAFAAKLLCYER